MRGTALALTLLATRAYAEPAPVLPPLSPLHARPEASLSPFRLDAGDLVRIEHKARWKRNVGIGLSVPGVTFMVLGGVLIGAGVGEFRSANSRFVTAATELATGSVSAGIGLVFTVPGALLWVSGQDDLDLAKWRRSRMTTP